MALRNPEIADVLDELADLLELENANPFRVRAYRNAARIVRALPKPVNVLLYEGRDLSEYHGIGKDLASKIAEIADSGTVGVLESMRKQVPPIALELLHIPGIGPKRASALYHELDIHTREQLYRAVLDGRVRSLSGFGPKQAARLKEALESAAVAEPARHSIAAVTPVAKDFTEYLQSLPGVDQVEVAGSYRRGRETVGDLDILVTAAKGKKIIEAFTGVEEIKEIVSAGSTRATVILRSGLQVDLRVVPKVSYGAALHYFTGSKAHNIAVRGLAQKKGLKVNEYGVFRGDKRVAGKSEESVFRSAGLPYIPPELRENRGEIEAALEGNLPHLIALKDLKGDLHVHSSASDGHNTILEMAEAAGERGLDYIAITDHSKKVTVAHGLTVRRLEAQINEIEQLNEKRGRKARVLAGIECDILEDGKLDLPDSVLAKLDLVIGAVHSKFDLPRARQTDRILRAMDNPRVSILAHPTGRLIPKREPYDVDMALIIRAAKENGVFLELNAHPERLDLHETHCQMAKTEGVLIAINSDAHRTSGLNVLEFGISQARRGWLEKKDVLNTRSLSALIRLLQNRR
jgi:DNA polymerase (family 10)